MPSIVIFSFYFAFFSIAGFLSLLDAYAAGASKVLGNSSHNRTGSSSSASAKAGLSEARGAGSHNRTGSSSSACAKAGLSEARSAGSLDQPSLSMQEENIMSIEVHKGSSGSGLGLGLIDGLVGDRGEEVGGGRLGCVCFLVSAY